MGRLARAGEAILVASGFSALLAWSAWRLAGVRPLAALPVPPLPLLAASPLGPWPTLIALVLLAPALLAFRKRGHAAAGLTAVAAGVLIPAAYTYSNLDWTRLIKDLDLSRGGTPAPGVVLVACLPIAYAVGYHLLHSAREARSHYVEKGVPPEDARRAPLAVARLGGLALAGGAAAALGLALALQLGAGGLPGPWRAGSLAAPVTAALLVTGAIFLLLRDHRRGAAEAAGADDGDAEE